MVGFLLQLWFMCQVVLLVADTKMACYVHILTTLLTDLMTIFIILKEFCANRRQQWYPIIKLMRLHIDLKLWSYMALPIASCPTTNDVIFNLYNALSPK